jgi:hypothetical protein
MVSLLRSQQNRYCERSCKAVKTPLDEHYYAVMMHKGISNDLPHLAFGGVLVTLLEIYEVLPRQTKSISR